jgi:DNA primase
MKNKSIKTMRCFLMAKTYVSAIKYEIKASYEVGGIVEKPDIVGAIFGQSEGLLGEGMDLKELQQNGKIGRIEVTVNRGKGTTYGEIIIPSSLDQVKTSILGATMETVDKVGPCDSKIKVLQISDTRKEKREVIADRAKELLKRMQQFEGVETQELADSIKSDVRTEKVIDFKGLTAGPEVPDAMEIIVVEGRADVLKLLSYGIKNAVAMNGTNISRELVELCKTKEVTILVDGDRGGEMNAKKLASLTRVDYVARAPDGKEVEELTQKEILLSIKRKIALADAFESFNQRKPEYGFKKTFNDEHAERAQGNERAGSRNEMSSSNSSSFGRRESRHDIRNDSRTGNSNFRNEGRTNFRNDSRNESYPRNEGSYKPRFSYDKPFDRRNERSSSSGSNGSGFDSNERKPFPRTFDSNEDRPRRPSIEDVINQKLNMMHGVKMPSIEEVSTVAGKIASGVATAVKTELKSEMKAEKHLEKQVEKQVEKAVHEWPSEIKKLEKTFAKMKGKLKANLLDEKHKKIKEVNVKELVEAIEKSKKKVSTVVLDGIITKRLLEICEAKGITSVIGVKKGPDAKSEKVKTYTM